MTTPNNNTPAARAGCLACDNADRLVLGEVKDPDPYAAVRASLKRQMLASTFDEEFEGTFIGEITVEEYAKELKKKMVKTHKVPKCVARYLSVEMIAHDLLYNNKVFLMDGFLFRAY